MNKKDLAFIIAYATVYGMINKSVIEVLDTIKKDENIYNYLNYNGCSMDEFISDFMKVFNWLKDEGQLDNITAYLTGTNKTIWQAEDAYCEYMETQEEEYFETLYMERYSF